MLPYTGLLTLVHQPEVVLTRAVHEHWCKAFADRSVYKQVDLPVLGEVACQNFPTSTKICKNFNSVIPSAKGEKPRGDC